jgi:co-chaperonin GroES (HSP10)
MNDVTEAQDNTEWLNDEAAEIPRDLPQPALWRMLVMPVQPNRETKSGIVIPVAAQEAEEHLQVIGRVAALGPLAYKSEKFVSCPEDRALIADGKPVSWAPKVGDWIIYGRYTGQRLEYRDTRFILMNDDEILGQIASPDGFRVYL